TPANGPIAFSLLLIFAIPKHLTLNQNYSLFIIRLVQLSHHNKQNTVFLQAYTKYMYRLTFIENKALF
ncbi:MAG: hypothetical protein OSA80_09470, partial [Porticoccaceae bacterium]|nr:hypothetical protein [Porticoccaceae bacterium]